MPVFEVTYVYGSVEEIEADDCSEMGRHLPFVNYRVLFVTTIYGTSPGMPALDFLALGSTAMNDRARSLSAA